MKHNYQRFAAAAVLVLAALPCVAQTTISARIDRFVTAEMKTRKIPGVAVAVLRHGKVPIVRTYGFANLEHRVPVKPQTIFQSGSMGKQFTAAAVMILVQEGKISLDDRITKYFSNTPEAWKDITVRRLLTHTAGMGDYPLEIDLRRDYTEDQLLDFFKKAKLAFEPGEGWDYSNVGYVMLGIMIRKVTGKFYGDFLQERIFRTLGMNTARVISEADIVPNRAAGYRVVAGEIKNQEWVSPSTNSTADGSLYFSILDLAKWDAALYTNEPLRQTTLAQVWAPVSLKSGARKGYGFGWFTDIMHNRRVVFHGGAWQGFKTCIMRFPDEKLTVIVLANSWNTREFKLARGLAALFYSEFAVPSARAIEADAKVNTLLHRFLAKLSHEQVETELLTPELTTNLTRERVREAARTLNSLTLPIALINSEELVERREENGLRVFRYLFNDIPKTLTATIKLTSDDKIAEFDLAEVKAQ